MPARVHSNPQCPVPLWERYGRMYGYERPKCACIDAEPEPEPMTLELPFDEIRDPPPTPTGELTFCTNCGSTDGYHKEWCHRWRG